MARYCYAISAVFHAPQIPICATFAPHAKRLRLCHNEYWTQ